MPPVMSPGTISRVLLTLETDETSQRAQRGKHLIERRERRRGENLHVVLGGLHVESTHASELLDLASSEETLHREGAEGTAFETKRQQRELTESPESTSSLVTGEGANDGSRDGLGVHAALQSVGEGDERPEGRQISKTARRKERERG